MNQTKKRLSIINLAISIGDIETIQLQILRLSPLKNDEKIQEILEGLRAENYAQTQALITEYIESPTAGIHQRTLDDYTQTPKEEEEAVIKEFDLFTLPENESEEMQNINLIEDPLTPEDGSTIQTIGATPDFDALLNLTGEDIRTNQVDLAASHPIESADDFFQSTGEDTPKSESQDDDFFSEETDTDNEVQSAADQPLSSSIEKNQQNTPKEDTDPLHYQPIPYIDQKLRNMTTQFPPLEEAEENFASVDNLLIKIANEGYTEKEIEDTLHKVKSLTQKGERAEAALLLLICAATHSKYAQFMLARSLFKGDLIQKDLAESFTQINRLAMDEDYPEAICDLGQLYEYGIGIDKDRVRAEALYKEAMELGIERAKTHYERVHKANKSLLGRLFKRS